MNRRTKLTIVLIVLSLSLFFGEVMKTALQHWDETPYTQHWGEK